MSLVKIPIKDSFFHNDGNGTPQRAGCSRLGILDQENPMSDAEDHFARLLGRAAMDVWGDMPRDIQEALFETAMKERSTEREELARLLHGRHPRTLHPARPG
jgi:hypothetical protein